MFKVIVTEQTLSGMIDRVVSESGTLALAMLMESFWADRERTLMTRIEIEEN